MFRVLLAGLCNAGPEYIRFFYYFLLAHEIPAFQHVQDKTRHK